tara:strand:+ start:892 stop:1110 length:219 start_codon:yes stop_codon:yes gene_type:complete
MKNNLTLVQEILENKVYKQILSDSFGGIMYNVDNKNKYDTTELKKIYDKLTPQQLSGFDGIMKGALYFVFVD